MRLPAASQSGRVTVRGVLTVALLAFALAGVIAVVALADHHHKNAQSWEANQASWFCDFKGTRCDELQYEDLERGWQHRELGYRIAFFSFSSGGTAAVIIAFALAWEGRRSAYSSPSA
jgi:H+/Cl- antiporter ClcA